MNYKMAAIIKLGDEWIQFESELKMSALSQSQIEKWIVFWS